MFPFCNDPESHSLESVHANSERSGSYSIALPIRLLFWGILAAAAVLPFIGTLQYELVWDDHYIVKQVEELWHKEGLYAVASAPFFPHPGVPNEYYRPVVNLSLWVDGRLGGGSAGWFHLTNILLHLGCTLLCSVVLRQLMIGDLEAFIGSLLFALHPAHVESIAFVSGRTDLLAALFVLIAMLLWRGSRDTDHPPSIRAILLFASALSFLAGSLSKENAVLLPIFLIVWDLWGANCRPPQNAGWWRRNSPWLGLYGLAVGVLLVLRHAALQPSPSELVVSEKTIPLLLKEPGFAMLGLLHMLRMMLLPWPHNALYTKQHLIIDVPSALAAAAVCVLLGWTNARRFNRVGGFGGPWVIIFLAPALLVSSSGAVVIAERYLYLPLLGFCMILGCLLGSIFKDHVRWRPAVVAAILMGALALGWMDFARTRVWRSDLTLGADMVRTSPGSALAHDRLGQALLAAGRYNEAFAPLLQAVKLEPFHSAYHNDLGIALRRLNQPALAAEAFRESLRLDPSRVGTRLNLAYACITLRDAACVEEQRRILATTDLAALAELDRALQKWWR